MHFHRSKPLETVGLDNNSDTDLEPAPKKQKTNKPKRYSYIVPPNLFACSSSARTLFINIQTMVELRNTIT